VTTRGEQSAKPTTQASWRSVVVFAGVIAGMLLLLNIVAHHLLPNVPGSHQESRNPFHFRGFPAYVDGLARSEAPQDLVLLSNSQGFAAEYRSHFSYPALLQATLNQDSDDPTWRIHNWSVAGITSLEYMAFAAKLHEVSADVIVACIGYADFKGRNAEQGFSHCRSDAPQILAETTWSALPFAFWKRHGLDHFDDLLSVLARANAPALRWPEYFWSSLNQQYPGMMTLFYAPDLRFHPWVVPVENIWPSPSIVRAPAPETESKYYQYDERSTMLLEEFLDALQRIDHARTRLLLVACPGNERPTSRRYSYHQRFREDLARLTQKRGILFCDLGDALAQEEFLNSIHFNKRGHRRFADRLLQELNPIFSRSSDALQ
jgi:hypothetical protein